LLELKRLFDREIIKDNGLGDKLTNNWREITTKMVPNEKKKRKMLEDFTF